VREKPEDELLRSAVVLQALPDGAVICDRIGIVRFINPAAARLWNFALAQLYDWIFRSTPA
jgi:PAS domain-containing protein